MTTNKSLIFKQVSSGTPIPGKDLTVEPRDIDLETSLTNGLIVQVLYVSFDPCLRLSVRDPGAEQYIPSLQKANQPIANVTVSRVIASGIPGYSEGDLVMASTPIAEYARLDNVITSPFDVASIPLVAFLITGKRATVSVAKLDNPRGLDPVLFLGPLGMPGLTAWSGLYKIGKPKKGETIFVSAAAGGVGHVVGQIAKREGLVVIGSVGSDEKLHFILNELGFDGGFNYRKEKPLDALRRLAPQGIDIYFDNVGGDHLEAAIEVMNHYGRIPVCGMISNYSFDPDKRTNGVQNLVHIVLKQITMQGFIVSDPDVGPAYTKKHQEILQSWIADGSFISKFSVTDGIDKAAHGLVSSLQGENIGKAVLKVAAS